MPAPFPSMVVRLMMTVTSEMLWEVTSLSGECSSTACSLLPEMVQSYTSIDSFDLLRRSSCRSPRYLYMEENDGT